MSKVLLCVILCGFGHVVHCADELISWHDMNLSAYRGRVTQCPMNMTSNADDSACVCLPGFYKVDGVCAQCEAGTFKAIAGDNACQSCRNHSVSLKGALSLNDCLCSKGYFLSGESCVSCASGTYKEFVGPSACLACPEFSGTLQTGSVSLTNCLCDEGYHGQNGGPCVACGNNTYKNVRGNFNCQPCPNYMLSDMASTANTDCRCREGYTGQNGQACTPCSVGSFKRQSGSAGCEQCPANSNSSLAASGCVSIRGYVAKNKIRFKRQLILTVGTFNDTARLNYRETVANDAKVSVSQVKIVSVTVITRRRLLSSTETLEIETEITASVEETDTVTSNLSDDVTVELAFDPCPENTYTASEGESACHDCPAHSHSSPGSVQCTCDAGYRGDWTACQSCPYDHFCDGTGLVKPEPCPENSTAPMFSVSEDNCTCLGGFEKEGLDS